jgi:hypothetical protein
MALYTTNPQETINVGEAAASRIPTVASTEPLNGAVNVAPGASISLNLTSGQLTLPVVSVNGTIVYANANPRRGWKAQALYLGESGRLILTPPVGFVYRSVVTVAVTFEPEAGTEDDTDDDFIPPLG